MSDYNSVLQRMIGIGLSCSGIAVSIISFLEQFCKSQNKRVMLLNYSLISAGFINSFIGTFLAINMTTGNFHEYSTIPALLVYTFGPICQMLLIFYMRKRSKVVIRDLNNNTKILIDLMLISLILISLAIMIFVYMAIAESSWYVITVIKNRFYNPYALWLEMVLIVFYSIYCTYIDMNILIIVRRSSANFIKESEERRLKFYVQINIIGICMVVRFVDSLLKVMSNLGIYLPIHLYFRIFSLSFEVWCIMKLGTTVSDLMSKSSVDNSMNSNSIK